MFIFRQPSAPNEHPCEPELSPPSSQNDDTRSWPEDDELLSSQGTQQGSLRGEMEWVPEEVEEIPPEERKRLNDVWLHGGTPENTFYVGLTLQLRSHRTQSPAPKDKFSMEIHDGVKEALHTQSFRTYYGAEAFLHLWPEKYCADGINYTYDSMTLEFPLRVGEYCCQIFFVVHSSGRRLTAKIYDPLLSSQEFCNTSCPFAYAYHNFCEDVWAYADMTPRQFIGSYSTRLDHQQGRPAWVVLLNYPASLGCLVSDDTVRENVERFHEMYPENQETVQFKNEGGLRATFSGTQHVKCEDVEMSETEEEEHELHNMGRTAWQTKLRMLKDKQDEDIQEAGQTAHSSKQLLPSKSIISDKDRDTPIETTRQRSALIPLSYNTGNSRKHMRDNNQTPRRSKRLQKSPASPPLKPSALTASALRALEERQTMIVKDEMFERYFREMKSRRNLPQWTVTLEAAEGKKRGAEMEMNVGATKKGNPNTMLVNENAKVVPQIPIPAVVLKGAVGRRRKRVTDSFDSPGPTLAVENQDRDQDQQGRTNKKKRVVKKRLIGG